MRVSGARFRDSQERRTLQRGRNEDYEKRDYKNLRTEELAPSSIGCPETLS